MISETTPEPLEDPEELKARFQRALTSDALTKENKRELAYLYGSARMLDAAVALMLDDLGIR